MECWDGARFEWRRTCCSDVRHLVGLAQNCADTDCFCAGFRATAIYAQGAGLGASKGKEITKITNPFDYSSNAKDAVSLIQSL